MNGPTKDAGVERIARIIDPIAAEMEGRITSSVAFNQTAQAEWNAALAKAREILSLLPHPAVDPAAEEVAGRLETASQIAKNGNWARTLVSTALIDEAATLIRSMSARIAELEGALELADTALRDYACHGGPDVPCLRTPDQCASECGKAAGDALLVVLAALAPTASSETKARVALGATNGEAERG